jgi:hypothetical protein
MAKHTIDMPTPERHEINWLEAVLGSVLGGFAYWALLQFPGRLLQAALRLPGQWLVYDGLGPALARMGVSVNEIAAAGLAHSLCLVPFALFGAAILVRERGWVITMGLALALGLMLALMIVWRFG